MSIKRYTISGLHPHIIESKDGFMVYYEDYARLKAFSDEAQAHIAKEERKSRERLDIEQAETARLKAEVEAVTQEYRDATNHYNKLNNDLQAELESLRYITVTSSVSQGKSILPELEQIARLEAEVERLTKAVINAEDVIRFTEEGVQNVPFKYDEKYTIEVSRDAYFRLSAVVIADWNAAKEGKQP